LIGNWNDLASIIEPEFDEVESLADYVAAEYRLQIEEVA
jgi:hypothetical protein